MFKTFLADSKYKKVLVTIIYFIVFATVACFFAAYIQMTLTQAAYYSLQQP